MKRIIAIIIYSVLVTCGFLQFLLLPGMVWNVVSPILPALLVLWGVRKRQKVKSLRFMSLLLLLLLIADFALIIKSNFNTQLKNPKTEINIMSYNVFFKNKMKSQCTDLILANNPDILLLQEITPAWADFLNQKLNKKYPYRKTLPLKGTHGIGIYSKYKITKNQFLNNNYKKPFAQIADIVIDGKTYLFINTHLASPAVAVENQDQFIPLYLENHKTRKAQVKRLNSNLQTTNKNYAGQFLIGDLNTMQIEPITKLLKYSWTSTNSNWLRWKNLNFPHSSKVPPVMCLDYIYGHGAINFKDFKVIPGGSSDHLAVTTIVEL